MRVAVEGTCSSVIILLGVDHCVGSDQRLSCGCLMVVFRLAADLLRSNIRRAPETYTEIRMPTMTISKHRFQSPSTKRYRQEAFRGMEQLCDWDVECHNDIGYGVTDLVLDEMLESVSLCPGKCEETCSLFTKQSLVVPYQSNRPIGPHCQLSQMVVCLVLVVPCL